MVKRVLTASLCMMLAQFSSAAELGIGTTRAEVIAQLGEPKSKMSAGAREILGYANARITLVEGKVASIDWKSAPTPATAPAPAVDTASARSEAMLPVAPKSKAPAVAAPAPARGVAREAWTTDFAAAQAEATASKRRLLVLFTGSDWCPPCKRFEAEVAHAPEFLNLATTSFVLVKLDYPRNTPQSPAIRTRNEALLRKYGVDSYPTLMVISADGEKSARVDTRSSRQADSMADFYTQAVDEARRSKEKASFWPW